uniref:Ig-like domain-containing protein n=1 Tax=Coturnix japonica TaxID=93934 RepID=A0A8C2SPY6_COTJA
MTYKAVSSFRMTQTEGKSRQPFRCRATHPRGNAELIIENPGSTPSNTPVQVTIHPPSRDAFDGPFRNATVLCQTKGNRKAKQVNWYKNGSPVIGSNVQYWTGTVGTQTVTQSKVEVTESEWDSGVVFSCVVDGEMRNTSKRMECGLDTPDPAEISVRVFPPSFVDIFLSKTAKLKCRVSNMANVDGLEVSWWKEKGGRMETSVGQKVLQSNGFYMVEATTSVCVDEWDGGDAYVCRVNHPELLFPVEERMKKTEARNARPPSISIYPPPSDQQPGLQRLSITCMIQGFNPPDFFVRWLRNGEPLPQSHWLTTTPLNQGEDPINESYVAYSLLKVGAEEWGAGNVYSCLVGHEALPLQLAQKSVDKASGKSSAVNVSLVLADSASACY